MEKDVHSGDSILFPGPNFTPPGVPAETYELTVAQLQPQCPSVHTFVSNGSLPFSGQ